MKAHTVILAAATLLLSSGIGSAQKQYDSLGSPTPAPNQGVSPNVIAPNPNTGGVSSTGTNADANDQTGVGANGAKSETTGSGAVNGGVNGPANSGTTATDSSGAKIPGAITDD